MSSERKRLVVGVLSDTHGHLYQEVRQALEGADHIIHAGDVGTPRVLDTLAALAPVTAVRGNCDLDSWAESLPLRAELDLEGVRVVVGHVAGRLDPAGADVVITGHTHLATVEERNGVLYLDPGSAGPQRFQRPRTVARLVILPPATRGPQCGPEGEARGVRDRVAVEIVTVPDEQ